MNGVSFVDTSVRDAPQSLWNFGMTLPMMLPIAPVMDRVGFEAIDLIPMAGIDALPKLLEESFWDRVRLMARLTPNTPLITGGVLRAFGQVPDAVLELWVRTVAKAGARRMRINDPCHDLAAIAKAIGWCSDSGMTSLVGLIFAVSPAHTDAYYAAKARAVAKAGADRIFIKDVGGLLTPERTRTLVPKIQRVIGGLPLELHSHCTTGLAPIVYLEAVKLGVRYLHTAVAPLANGSSQPSIQNIRKNLRVMGIPSNIDENALEEMTRYFTDVAKRAGKPSGAPLEYDLEQYEHQMPGGMVSNFYAQVAKRGLAHRWSDLLGEMARIRGELGYPIMVTPLSQYVGVQAILNVSGGGRYETVTDEIIHYALGHYGELAAPVDDAVMRRIEVLPRTAELRQRRSPAVTIEALRREIGPALSDEDFLSVAMSTDQGRSARALMARGPQRYDQDFSSTPMEPVMALLTGLARRTDLGYVQVNAEDVSLTLRTNRGRRG